MTVKKLILKIMQESRTKSKTIWILIAKMKISLIKVMILNWKKNFLGRNNKTNIINKKNKLRKKKSKKSSIKMILKKK